MKYTNIEDGIARFTLYKNNKAIHGFNERIENVPDEYDIGDYFSTQINSEDLMRPISIPRISTSIPN